MRADRPPDGKTENTESDRQIHKQQRLRGNYLEAILRLAIFSGSTSAGVVQDCQTTTGVRSLKAC
jgi:hypothetical protein